MVMGPVIDNSEDNYFTIAYILFTVAIVMQVIYYSFVVYSYQNIKKRLIEEGRLLQVTPIIGIATVCTQSVQAINCGVHPCSGHPQIPPYPGSAKVINGKEAPPPYLP